MPKFRKGRSLDADCAVAVLALLLGAFDASAQLTGGQVVAGQATISAPSATSTIIQQKSQSTIINWSGFSIPSGSSVAFQQPNASAIALNRVTGGSVSQIYGTLTANGRVWLVNRNGIVLGPSAQVSAAGVLLSTMDIRDQDFLSGNYSFGIPGNPDAAIVNGGRIVATDGGSVVLAAPRVRNDGLIEADLGTVVLAGAKTLTVDFAGDDLLKFAVPTSAVDGVTGTDALVSNAGTIAAPGGRVLLTAAAAKGILDNVINTSGIVEATSVASVNGKIVLSASGGGAQVSGTLDASGKGAGESGGTIEVLGDAVRLASGARLDAAGDAGGGKVIVGGNFHGAGPEPNAQATVIEAGSLIDVSALTRGNGGRVAVWSDGSTTFSGDIRARGGATGGNGGFIETSGAALDIAGARVDLSAPKGKAGAWLLDPDAVTIDPSFAATISSALASGDVLIMTTASAPSGLAPPPNDVSPGNGDITVNAPISWNSPNGLLLIAFRDINIDAAINNSNVGTVFLRADNTGTGNGSVTFGRNGTVSTGGSTIIFYNPTLNPGNGIVNPSSFTTPDSFTQISGSVTAFMLVNDVADLQNVQNNLGANFALGRGIDASATAGWNGGIGFIPVGNGSTPFTGEFDGETHTISGLTINSGASGSGAGLFGTTGISALIHNVDLANVSINATGSNMSVGALVGLNEGGIFTASASSGSVTSSGSGSYVGGLVGANGFVSLTTALIGDSHASVSVSATNAISVGGLVGYNVDAVVLSYATGPVSAGAGVYGGGLAGANNSQDPSNPATISQSFATGNVSGVGAGLGISHPLGGLTAYNGGVITDSYATGNVTFTPASGDAAGGLVGLNDAQFGAGSIFTSYATGMPSGAQSIGGLVGVNNGSISSSFWDVASSGTSAGVGSGPTNGATPLGGGLPPGFDSEIWAVDPNTGLPVLALINSSSTTGGPTSPSSSPSDCSSSQPDACTSSENPSTVQNAISQPSQPVFPASFGDAEFGSSGGSPATSSGAFGGSGFAPPTALLASEPLVLQPASGESGGSGRLATVSDLDVGSQMFSQIVPTSGGDSGPSREEVLTFIEPITLAPQPFPVLQSADEPVGGSGSRLFRERPTVARPVGVPGIIDGALNSGNRGLWFSLGRGN